MSRLHSPRLPFAIAVAVLLSGCIRANQEPISSPELLGLQQGALPAPTMDQVLRLDDLALTLSGYTELRARHQNLSKQDVLWIAEVALALQSRAGFSLDAPGWAPLAQFALGDLPHAKLPSKIKTLIENPQNPGDLPFVVAKRAEPIVWRATLQQWMNSVPIQQNAQLLAQLP